MSTQDSDDIVLKVLLNTARDVASEVPIEFLCKIYEIQKKHQFSQDNNESYQLMEKLIDEQVGGAE